MNLTIRTKDAKIGRAAEARLRDAGHFACFELDEHVATNRLRLPAGVDLRQAAALARDFAPLPMTIGVEPNLGQPVVELAPVAWPESTRVRIAAPRHDQVRPVTIALRALGVRVYESLREGATRARMDCVGLHDDQVAFLLWLAGSGGQPVGIGRRDARCGDHAEADILLAAGATALAWPQVVVHSDDSDAAGRVALRLQAHGFSEVRVVGLPQGPARDRFLISQPDGLAPENQPGWSDCAAVVALALSEAGIDGAGMPLQPAPVVVGWPATASAQQVCVCLPFARARAGTLVPWAGDSPLRFQWVVRGDDAGLCAKATAALAAAGFRVRKEAAMPQWRRPPQSRATVGEAAAMPQQLQAAFALVQASCPGIVCGANGGLDVVVDASLTNQVYLDLETPVEPLAFARRAACALQGAAVRLEASQCSVAAALVRPILAATLGARLRLTSAADRHDKACVRHSGGLGLAAQQLAAAVGALIGSTVPVRITEGLSDGVVTIELPDDAMAVDSAGDPFGDDWGVSASSDRAFLHEVASAVWIGQVLLQKRDGPRHVDAPAPDLIDGICLDRPTRSLLLAVAQAVAASEPLLIEGPTSATKTTAILLLASLLGQPVLRVNLSGQTDCAELVGQFVPAEGGGFRWQDGAAARAALGGYWLILDEVNLAPPQIQERLNPLLERRPSLTLTEHDQRVIGSARYPIHPNFRVFGTMNSADYAGRSTMSAAGKDRWLHQHIAHAPDADALRDLLLHAAFGDQPVLPPWQVAVAPALRPGDALFAGASPHTRATLTAFFGRVAELQGRTLAVPASEGAPPLGANRQEPYTFTRRGLLALVGRLHRDWVNGADLHLAMRAALRQTYVDRVADEDRASLGVLLDAFGIGPRCWKVGAPAANDSSAAATEPAEAA